MTGESVIEEKLKYLDPLLKEFLQFMEVEGHLGNTLVHFYGVHGENVSPLSMLTNSGIQERMNPFYYYILPHLLNKGDVAHNISTNQNNLITHHDIYANDFKILDEKTPVDGISPMTQNLRYQDCKRAKINDNCYCKNAF